MDSLQIKTVGYQAEIAAIKHIRTKVFQEEQGVSAELEFDGLDADTTHFLAYINHEAVGTARIREIDRDTTKIERLAVLPQARKQGIGKKLMSAALEVISDQNKIRAIVYSQEYITPLYQGLGFEIVGEKFSEAGMSHVKMVKQLS
ncbi:GNAT family N-acetyltransferase [Waterburya agarophytonicola K14]|uniref:GNAT family N-acetyltransferase n=1 Tax=Waterburya agarophytonicola KI4 TaxID=2874699 RepID=A0A964FGE9_9CYAN|nr:GNAT family N-acetyltransferase [Waterburya agarophytonicola]MCC0178107.1 GNAT family N-acetyltransferase [Waterburya agarophytonicola KI4]